MARRDAISARPSLALKLINSAQKDYRLRLTTDAKRILTASIRGRQKSNEELNWAEVQRSLDRIFADISTRADGLESVGAVQITPVQVMQAIQRLWCNIPPFCGPDK